MENWTHNVLHSAEDNRLQWQHQWVALNKVHKEEAQWDTQWAKSMQKKRHNKEPCFEVLQFKQLDLDLTLCLCFGAVWKDVSYDLCHCPTHHVSEAAPLKHHWKPSQRTHQCMHQATLEMIIQRLCAQHDEWCQLEGRAQHSAHPIATNIVHHGRMNPWCQKSIWNDNGAISSVIRTTNGSRVPSSRPRTDVRPNGKDTRSNAEHKVERKRWVPTPCSIAMAYNPTGMW